MADRPQLEIDRDIVWNWWEILNDQEDGPTDAEIDSLLLQLADRRAAPAPGGEAKLIEALKECMAAVEIFHGKDAWDIYRDHSPEMKRWRAAIADAERAKP